MNKNIKLFYLFSKASIKSYLASPLGLILFTFGKIIRFILFLLLIIFVVAGTKTLKGYNSDQAIIFFLSFNLVDTGSQFLFREVYRFRPLIISGDFDQILIKPYHPFLRILFGGVDILDFIMLLFYFPLTIFFIIHTGYFNLLSMIGYLLLITNALIIATGFHIIVLAFAILTTEVDHSIMIFRDLTSTGRFPMEIYPLAFQTILTFIIPVALMMSFPAKILLNMLSFWLFLFTFIFTAGFLFISIKIWQKALIKYQSWGG